MWLLLSLLVVTSDNTKLELTNVRTTYGVMGAERADEKILPGDQVVLSFDILGASVGDNGKIQYSIAMEVANSQGKVLFKQAPRDLEAPAPTGSKALPACAALDVGTAQPPGEYTVKVAVKDRTSGATQSIARTYQLLPKGFGLVRYSTTRDPDGRLPVATLVSGRPGWINFSAVGFERDPQSGQPNVAVQMQVLNPDGQDLLKPVFGQVRENIPKGAIALPMQFEVALPFAGDCTVVLTATDKISGQTAVLKVPLSVAAQN
jgi:hypothetical protein